MINRRRHYQFLAVCSLLALMLMTALEAGSVRIEWDSQSDPGVVGYHVYRSDSAGGPYQRMTANPVGISIFTDRSVSIGATYYYVVTAVTAEGMESELSSELEVRVQEKDVERETLGASTGADRTVRSGATVLLSGVAWGAPEEEMSFTWSWVTGPNATLVQGVAGAVSFVAPEVTSETVFELELMVEIPSGETARDRILITVQPLL